MTDIRHSTCPTLWLHAALAGVILLLCAVLSVALAGNPPTTNGLGLLPSTEQLLVQSGITLQMPSGRPRVSLAQAESAAEQQGPQSVVRRGFLATVQGPLADGLSESGRLCWVVFLRTSRNALGNPPAPGRVSLYAVLVDARSGRFVRSVIAFSATVPHSGVGTE